MVLRRNGKALTRLSVDTSPRITSVGGTHISNAVLDLLTTTQRKRVSRFYPVAIAILSFYGGLAVFGKIVSAFSSKKPATVPVPVLPSTTEDSAGIPSIESAAFEKFLETSAFEKLLENEDQLTKLAESA
jgi:hypothetical protein